MKVEALVTGIIRDAKTGEITRTFQETNHVSWWMLGEMTTGSGMEDFGHYIYVTDFPYATEDRVSQIWGSPGHIATGVTEIGITSPLDIAGGGSGMTPYGVQFQQRFSPPAIDRTIRYIGLNSAATIGTYGNISNSHCGVRLSSDCTQLTSETLDVFYRVQFPFAYDAYDTDTYIPFGSYGITNAQAYLLFAMSAETRYSTQWPTNGSATTWNGNVNTNRLNLSYHSYPPSDTNVPSGSIFTPYASTSLFRNQLRNVADIADGLGHIIGCFCYGDDDGYCRFQTPALKPDDSPIQSIFAHGAAATKPFYDSGNLPAGDGTLLLGGDTWENPSFPKQYRVNITTTGAVDTSEYQLWERNHFGYQNNTYKNNVRNLNSTTTTNDQVYQNFRMIKDYSGSWSYDINGPRFQRWGTSEKHTIAIREDEICLANMQIEEGKRFDVNNFPLFAPTQITDISVESDGTIYVACRSTGLYKISDPDGSPTITVIDDTTTGLTGAASAEVYGVAVGRNDRVWIIMDGGLFYSDNSGTSWTSATFSYTGISDANWSTVKQISADIEHVNDHLGIVYHPTTTSLVVCWYEFSTTTASIGPNVCGPFYASDNLHGKFWWDKDLEHTYIGSLAVSRTESRWGNSCRRTSNNSSYGNPAYFTFATTTIDSYAGTAYQYSFAINEFDTDENGDQSLMLINTEAPSYAAGFFMHTTLARNIEEYAIQSSDWDGQGDIFNGVMGYLGGWVFIGYQQEWLMGTLHAGNRATDTTAPSGGVAENSIWKKYGWEGSPGAWVVGSSGSKPTHSTEDDAIDGLTIQFDDDGGTQSFSSGDYHTIGCLRGIWLDGATEYTHDSFLYFLPIHDDVDLEYSTIPGTTRIPSVSRTYSSFAYQDKTTGVASTADSIRLSSTYAGPGYDRGGRSTTSVGGALTTTPGGKLSTDKYHVRFGFQLDGNGASTWNTARMLLGLSDDSVGGNAIGFSSPQFAFHCDGQADPTELLEISIVESGTTVFTWPDLVPGYDWQDGRGNVDFNIGILPDGTVEYSIENAVIYTSLVTATATNDWIIDFAAMGGTYAGSEDMRLYGPMTRAGHWCEIGQAGSPATGRYRPNYKYMDWDRMNVYIDGASATRVAFDFDTPPAIGEYAVYATTGEIELAAADVGKSITATYHTITTE